MLLIKTSYLHRLRFGFAFNCFLFQHVHNYRKLKPDKENYIENEHQRLPRGRKQPRSLVSCARYSVRDDKSDDNADRIVKEQKNKRADKNTPR